MESGQLYVEMRIPEVDDEADHPGGGDGEIVTAEDRTVPCWLCGKMFRSKMALSGHMRVHVQNKRESTKKKCRELAAEVCLLAEGKPPTCVVCGKTFSSMYALYGHMRSHPDRRWRGVQPPVTDVKPEPVIDCDPVTAVIAGWSITGKRGRRSIPSVDSGSTPGSEVEDLSTPEKGLEEKVDIRCFEGGEVDETEKCAIVLVESYSIPEKHRDDRDIKTEEAGSENPRTVPDNQRLKNRSIKRKVRQLDEINRDHSTKRATADVFGRIAANEYTCKRCNKSFGSPKALGGHRSSCNKSNQRASRAVVKETRPQSPSPQSRTEFTEATAVGQAAETYHFPEVFSRVCSSDAGCAGRLAGFDLNKLPTMQESEDEEEPEPNAKVECGSYCPSMRKPALVMGLST